MPPPLPVSINYPADVYNAYLPSTNSGWSTTLRCLAFLFSNRGKRSHVNKSLVRTIPAAATADDKSPAGAFWVFAFAAENTVNPTISWAVRRISYTLVSGSSVSGKVTGSSQNGNYPHHFRFRQWQKDLRSLPSTRTASKYFTVPFDCAWIERSIYAYSLHQIWICFRIEIVAPVQGSMLSC